MKTYLKKIIEIVVPLIKFAPSLIGQQSKNIPVNPSYKVFMSFRPYSCVLVILFLSQYVRIEIFLVRMIMHLDVFVEKLF